MAGKARSAATPFETDELGRMQRVRNLEMLPSVADIGNEAPEPCVPSHRAARPPGTNRPPNVYVFNPFAEGYIGQRKAFTPVKHQIALAEDLANLPQFLCQPEDIVLLPNLPAASFLEGLKAAGFCSPEFVALRGGRLHRADPAFSRKLGSLQPWAWGPDSVQLLRPLFALVSAENQSANTYFSADIARLYSKAWSAQFLRKVVTEACGKTTAGWLCTQAEAGRAVNTFSDALGAVAAIRRAGHHRVVVKEAYGLAGHNSIRLWEPQLLPPQRKWLASAVEKGREVVVEPWLERELDFSVQMKMTPEGLKLCGYTGLRNDLKGQYLANWAEPNYSAALPGGAAALLAAAADVSPQLGELYRKISSRLELELQKAGFRGPVSIDAFIYRTARGDCRLKPIVEINPRYTLGRLTLELVKHASPGTCGRFRLVTRAQARAEGFAELSSYARALSERHPLQMETAAFPKIRRGALCLNDPRQAQVCLATLEVNPALMPR